MQIQTTSDLKGLRILLGLSPSEAAALIGEDKDWLVGAERGRSWNISPKYRDALLTWETHVQALIDEVSHEGSPYALVYPNDDVYRAFAPEWAERLPTAHMHLTACARAKAEIAAEHGAELALVTFWPKAYDEFLAHNGVQDSPAERQRWAAAYARNYRVMDAKAGASTARTPS